MPTEIDRHEVQRLVAAGAQLIDVMPKAEWEESHLPGAVHVPLKKLDWGPEPSCASASKVPMERAGQNRSPSDGGAEPGIRFSVFALRTAAS